MIVDAHIHLYDTFEGLPGSAPEQLVKELKNRGISKAWTFTLNGFFGNCREENDKLAELCARSGGMFIPFMTVNPRDEREAVEEVERAYYELGMKGLKIHNWLQAFSLTNKWFHEIVKKCCQLSIPIVFHDGTPPYCTPLQICHIAEKYPQSTIILAHSGINDLWREALYGAERNRNVYLCTCSAQYIGLKEIVIRLGPERVIYGSDAGFGDAGIIDDNLKKVYLLGLKDSDLEKVLYKNAEHILGTQICSI